MFFYAFNLQETELVTISFLVELKSKTNFKSAYFTNFTVKYIFLISCDLICVFSTLKKNLVNSQKKKNIKLFCWFDALVRYLHTIFFVLHVI